MFDFGPYQAHEVLVLALVHDWDSPSPYIV